MQLLVENSLESNRSLEVLDLRQNCLSPMCAPALERLVRNNSTLQVLCLPFNRIQDDGAAAIAVALPYNRSLTELDLRSCSIGNQGMVKVADAMAAASTVAKTHVWGNGFGLSAAAAWHGLVQRKVDSQLAFWMDIEPYEVDGVLMVAYAND
jgi:Ran GTPase-activating protein (RanGAP) involved in mRNA processing and transport